MSDSAFLDAQPRSTAGKQTSKRLRSAGSIPAVVYGTDIDAIKCSVEGRAFESVMHDFGRNAIVSLKMDGNGAAEYSTIVKEVQHHPVTGEILHIDFHRISMTQRIVVEVTIHAEGSPLGVRNDGGILEQLLHQVEVECLPTNIPETMVYDVTELQIGDSIHVSNLAAPEGATIVTDGDRSVFSLIPPSVRLDAEEDEEVEEVEDMDAQEPEVIERGKKDEEEEGDGE